MCQGLNSHYFHIIGDGHQPNNRVLYTNYKDSVIKGGRSPIPKKNATFDHDTYAVFWDPKKKLGKMLLFVGFVGSSALFSTVVSEILRCKPPEILPPNDGFKNVSPASNRASFWVPMLVFGGV